jgi:hypothetical protein
MADSSLEWEPWRNLILNRNLGVVISVFLTATISFGQSGTGKLKTEVSPSRAGVFVDGKYVGPAGNFGFARTYTLPAGQHQILLTEPRYKDVTTTVTITAGKTTKMTDKLEKLPPPQGPFGILRTIHPDKFAAVYVNNKYYGHVDEFSNFAQGLEIPVGEYEVRIVPVTGQEHTEKVKIQANQTTIVKAQ